MLQNKMFRAVKRTTLVFGGALVALSLVASHAEAYSTIRENYGNWTTYAEIENGQVTSSAGFTSDSGTLAIFRWFQFSRVPRLEVRVDAGTFNLAERLSREPGTQMNVAIGVDGQWFEFAHPSFESGVGRDGRRTNDIVIDGNGHELDMDLLVDAVRRGQQAWIQIRAFSYESERPRWVRSYSYSLTGSARALGRAMNLIGL